MKEISLNSTKTLALEGLTFPMQKNRNASYEIKQTQINKCTLMQRGIMKTLPMKNEYRGRDRYQKENKPG